MRSESLSLRIENAAQAKGDFDFAPDALHGAFRCTWCRLEYDVASSSSSKTSRHFHSRVFLLWLPQPEQTFKFSLFRLFCVLLFSFLAALLAVHRCKTTCGTDRAPSPARPTSHVPLNRNFYDCTLAAIKRASAGRRTTGGL